MYFYYKTLLFSYILILSLWVPVTSSARDITLLDSIEQAIAANPQLRTFGHYLEMLRHDVRESRGGYLPTVDVEIGYGLEQYDEEELEEDSEELEEDSNDRAINNDWEARTDANLKLKQMIFDGWETSSKVSIQKALLKAGRKEYLAAEQAVTLDVITAHAQVFWQEVLVSLSEKNHEIHTIIYDSLVEREQAGAGSIAEVTQAQARLAQAESILHLNRANLSRAIASYTRVAGIAPGKLAYPNQPQRLPESLEDAISTCERRHPELMAIDAELEQAESRLDLAQSGYYPELDIELSSSYNDKLDGKETWQYNNTAMVFLRWNLYNGGRDQAVKNSARANKRQIRAKRAAKFTELTADLSTTWANYYALGKQRESYKTAIEFGRKTFYAYVDQFLVSQRTLLDVLNSEQDFFQSASQLIISSMNKKIAAYRMLALTGSLTDLTPADFEDTTEDYEQVKKSLMLPFNSRFSAMNTPVSIKEAPHRIRQTITIRPMTSLPKLLDLPHQVNLISSGEGLVRAD